MSDWQQRVHLGGWSPEERVELHRIAAGHPSPPPAVLRWRLVDCFVCGKITAERPMQPERSNCPDCGAPVLPALVAAVEPGSRIYDPAECDEHGVPLDWTRCRTCGGRGSTWDGESFSEDAGGRLEDPCAACGGHGSLRAAALDAISDGSGVLPQVHRCEDCGHPMSEGTWEGPAAALLGDSDFTAEEAVREWLDMAAWKREPVGQRVRHNITHWSPCDEGCRHQGALRVHGRNRPGEEWVRESDQWALTVAQLIGPTTPDREPWQVEASWRQVDVRTLGWPHDLRPERLAVLCLRCWAER
jgi:hypothetical protein